MSYSLLILGHLFGPSLCINLSAFLIVWPLAHVSSYRGTWLLRGIYPALEVQYHMEAGFKHPELHGCGKFHNV